MHRAVAVGFLHGFVHGLAALDEIADHPRLRETNLVAATRADLLRRAGRRAESAVQYRLAIERTDNDQARRFLRRRLTEVDAPAPS